jgi:hypothetical protein
VRTLNLLFLVLLALLVACAPDAYAPQAPLAGVTLLSCAEASSLPDDLQAFCGAAAEANASGYVVLSEVPLAEVRLVFYGSALYGSEGCVRGSTQEFLRCAAENVGSVYAVAVGGDVQGVAGKACPYAGTCHELRETP